MFEYCQSKLGEAETDSVEAAVPDTDTKDAKAPSGDKPQSLSNMFRVKDGEWECGMCCLRNQAKDAKCVACESPNPNLPAAQSSEVTSSTESTSVSMKVGSGRGFSFGESGFSFGSSFGSGSASGGSGISFGAISSGTPTTAQPTEAPTQSSKTGFSFASGTGFGNATFGSSSFLKPPTATTPDASDTKPKENSNAEDAAKSKP